MASAFVDFEAIRAAVKTCIGSAVVRVTYDGEPLGMDGFSGLDQAGLPIPGLTNPATDPAVSGGACRVTLAFSNTSGEGVDDMRRQYQDPAHGGDGTQTITQFGTRPFTLTVKVESDFSGPTLTICERIRNVMNRTSTHDVLRAVGVVIRDVGPTRTINVPPWDGKALDASILEVNMAGTVVEPDPLGETGTDPGCQNNWIQGVDPVGFEEV